MTWKSLAATVLGLILLAAGCKEITSANEGLPNDGGPDASLADTVTVVMEAFQFRAANGTDSLSIAVGQTVRFVNLDAAPHTATSTSAPSGLDFDSGRLSQNDEYYWRPTSPGRWEYRCDFHPVDMSGAVIRVTGSGTPPDTVDVPPDTLDTPPDTTDAGGDVAPDTIQVDIVDFAFRGPDGTSRLNVSLGQTVRFVNRGDADHTVTSTSSPAGAAFDSGNLDAGQVFYWTPRETGDWSYICDYHSEMTGTIAVSDSTGGGDGGGDDDDDGGDPSGTVSVAITDGGFAGPDGTGHVTISLGQTVEWRNEGVLVHTASATRAPDGGEKFDSGDLPPGATFRFTPDRPGVWRYRCDEHSQEAEGSLTVE